MANNPNVNAGIKWARAILNGKIPACRYVKLACQRHFNDLEKAKDKNYPFKFDPEKAEKKLKFQQLLPHTKGKWASKRELLKYEPWQNFGLAIVFGWVEKTTGRRRFREAYEEVPRKNGKSAKASAVGLSMFCADGEFGAEVYSGATSEKQAWEVFRPARLMVLRTPLLKKAAGIEVNASNINRPVDGSRFEPLIGKPGDGSSPSCAIVDEYHEHESSELYDTMDTGMGARDQPLIYTITTAGDNLEGPCYDMRDRVIEMLEGIAQDDRLFGWIFTIDEGDDWKDPKVLAKANPNLGVSVDYEYLVNQQKKAINRVRFQNRFKTKHLNIWVQAMEAYFNLEDWNKCYDSNLKLEDFYAQQCLVNLDLAARIDIAANIRLFWKIIDKKVHYYCVSPTFYLPSDAILNNEDQGAAERYQKWLNQGYITEHDGAELDFDLITDDVIDDKDYFAITEVPHDEWGAFQIAGALTKAGLTVVKMPKNVKTFSPAMKELDAAIRSGRFHHDGNPILKWMIGNVIAKPDKNDNVFPNKQKPSKKIDGAVALLMGINRVLMLTTGLRNDTLAEHIEKHGIRTL